jgi:tetratricopeptide (TPR) repeat protein
VTGGSGKNLLEFSAPLRLYGVNIHKGGIVTEVIEKQLKEFGNDELKLAELFKIDSSDVAALLLSGQTLYEQGRLEDAKNIFEGLLVLDSGNVFVSGILGAIYQKQGDYETALAYYDKTLSLFPDDIYSLTNRGEIHLKFGKLDKAAGDFRRAIELDPDRKHPAGNRARLLVEITLQCLEIAKRNGVEAVKEIAVKK